MLLNFHIKRAYDRLDISRNDKGARVMKVTADKITSLEDAHLAINSTMGAGFEAKCSLDDLYRWEHSPLRSQLFWVNMEGIFSFVSTHLVRHSAVGQSHFVMSNREDRGGAGDTEVNRLSLVNHRMLLNAQHLIDMSRKRLCFKASKETREVMLAIKEAIVQEDHDLATYMVTQCVYRGGYCSEPISCGNYKVRRYNPWVIADMITK